MNKFLRYSFIAILAFICGGAFADTYTYTFESKTFSAKEETKTLEGIKWTLTTDAEYFGYGNGGQQIGSKSKPAKTLVLNTTEIPGNISSVKVNTWGASGTDAKLEVKVGDVTFGETYALPSSTADKEFTGTASGQISLNYTQTTAKAIYIKSIEVVTDGKLPTVEVPQVANIAAFKALEAGTKAVLTLTNAQVQYVSDNDIFVVDATGGIDIYKSGLNYTAGQILNGTVEAVYAEYGKLPELTTITANNLVATDGTITPVIMTTEEAAKAENIGKLVTIKDVKAVLDDTKYYTDDTKALQIYNKFRLEGYDTPSTEETDEYTGIIMPYYAQMQIAITVIPATATSIDAITAEAAAKDAPLYNLAGQKVSKAYKGVVIQNGKKFVNK